MFLVTVSLLVNHLSLHLSLRQGIIGITVCGYRYSRLHLQISRYGMAAVIMPYAFGHFDIIYLHLVTESDRRQFRCIRIKQFKRIGSLYIWQGLVIEIFGINFSLGNFLMFLCTNRRKVRFGIVIGHFGSDTECTVLLHLLLTGNFIKRKVFRRRTVDSVSAVQTEFTFIRYGCTAFLTFYHGQFLVFYVRFWKFILFTILSIVYHCVFVNFY